MLVLGPHVREQHMKELKQTYYELEAGYNSFPLNLPGTRFHKAMRVSHEFVSESTLYMYVCMYILTSGERVRRS